MSKPFVAILMGSDSDLDSMQACIVTLDKLGIAREVNVLSAHRTPEATHAYVRDADQRGCAVFVACHRAHPRRPGAGPAMVRCSGRLLNKRNTFTDFIACAEYLVAEKFTHPGRLFAIGRSAGGLLMGAISNMRPELFHGIVAEVPFVDVVTTMLDPTIPLTTGEYDEWGDPNRKRDYDYMLSYSPCDNVARKDYPHLLITAGLHDSQVQYWEPANGRRSCGR